MNCHEVPEGTVNGAVTLTFSLERERNAAIMAIMPIIALIVLFGVVIAFFLKRLLDPVIETADEVKLVLGSAKQGDFSHRIAVRTDDEVGEIASNTNEFVEALENSIGAISKKITDISSHSIGKIKKSPENQILPLECFTYSHIQRLSFER
jgi:methyl-accepting chemotaxis protein